MLVVVPIDLYNGVHLVTTLCISDLLILACVEALPFLCSVPFCSMFPLALFLVCVCVSWMLQPAVCLLPEFLDKTLGWLGQLTCSLCRILWTMLMVTLLTKLCDIVITFM